MLVAWVASKQMEQVNKLGRALRKISKVLTRKIEVVVVPQKQMWNPRRWFIFRYIEATVRTRHERVDRFKIGRGVHQAVYYYPAYLTYMQSTSWEMLGWRKHKLESRLPGEISITSDMQMTPQLWQKRGRTKEPLDESERGEWKSWLKPQHSEN